MKSVRAWKEIGEIMIFMNFIFRSLSIALAFTWPAIVLAQPPKVIEFIAIDKNSKIATIHVNDQNLLYELADNSQSFLFTDEALFTINHKDKTYSVQSYDDLQVMASRAANEIAKSHEPAGSGPDLAFRLTGEVGTISGLKAYKIIKLSKGKPEAEIWASRDLTPLKLRAVGEKMRSVLPENYWGRGNGSIGLVEIIMLYGIPIKMVNDGQDVYEVRILERSSSVSPFQVPSGYRKVGN